MIVQMTVTLLLAIALSISGVYCPPTQFPAEYPLRSCEASVRGKLYLSQSSFKFYCSQQDPLYCSLIETYWTKDNDNSGEENSTKSENIFKFERDSVEFISMEDEKLTLMMYQIRYPGDANWSVTCQFSSPTMAQTFYKHITRDRDSKLEPVLRADYLKKSNDVVLATNPNIYVDGFGRNMKIVFKNDTDDVVLMIPKTAISRSIQRESTKIDLYTDVTRRQEKLYKIGFSTPTKASNWNQLLNTTRSSR